MLQLVLSDTRSSADISTNDTSLGASGAIGLVMLGLVAILLVGFALYKAVRAFRRPDMHGLTPEKVRERWKQIQTTASHGTIGMKMAVIEADSLLDAALKSVGMPGETMGERLKFAGHRNQKLTQVWPAHKLRNQLAHDTTFELRSRDAQRALRDFYQALEDLNVV